MDAELQKLHVIDSYKLVNTDKMTKLAVNTFKAVHIAAKEERNPDNLLVTVDRSKPLVHVAITLFLSI